MKGSPQDYMHVGIVHYMVFPKLMSGRGPLCETLGLLCDDDYFQAVEVTAFRDEVERKEAAVLAEQARKRVIFGAQPVIVRRGLDLHDDRPHERTRALDLVKEALSEATEWHAEAFEVMSGPDPGEVGREDAREKLKGALKEICETSRVTNGPPVLLESYDRWTHGRNCLIGPTREARSVAHHVACYFPLFGLTLDLGHLPLLNEDPTEAVKMAAPYLKHVHIGNCVKSFPDHPAYGDEHPTFGTESGANTLDDVALFLRALLGVGYIRPGGTNIVSIEMKPYGDQTEQDVLDNAKGALDAAWRRL